MNIRTVALLGVIAVAALWAGRCEAQYEGLAKYFPSRANSMAFLNVDRIYSSPYAQKEGWVEKAMAMHANSPLFFPSATDVAVLAAEFDLGNQHTLWEASLIQLKKPVDMQKISQLAGDQIEMLSGIAAVETPDGSYILKVSDNVLGSVFPANRQYVAQWARKVQEGQSGDLSPYLQEAASYASASGANTEIILALDMEGAVDPTELKDNLKSADTFKSHNVDIDEVVEVLSSIRGVTLGIRIGEQPFGSLKIDFEKDAKCLNECGMPLLLEILTYYGAYINEFENWEPSVEDNQFRISGNLDTAGLRAILSLIEPPPLHVEEYTTSPGEQVQPEQDPILVATMGHYNDVELLLRELKGRSSNTRGGSALYFDRYARKIDRLPLVNVDEDMLAYSSYVADTLRQLATVERGNAVENAQIGKELNPSIAAYGTGGTYGGSAYGGSVYGWGGYSYYRPRMSGATARRAATAGVNAQAAMDKSALYVQLDKADADIRKKFAEKYNKDLPDRPTKTGSP